jgi:CDP-6-deoxy-D-xylo-4-hexulose-3-dehydrase
LWLIEDNCDALGSRYHLNGSWNYTGTIGDIGTSSFYPPHHITMGEGGAVYTNDPLLYKIIKSMRDWGRECACPSGVDNLCEHRFDGQFGELPQGYDHKYIYSHFGYNLKVTEMQSAIGCAQLEKLPEFTRKRRENFKFLYNKLKVLEGTVILPAAAENSEPSWFGFPITLLKEADRRGVVTALEAKGIQTRLLFSGNLIRHPCFDAIRHDKIAYRVAGELKNTDIITERTFWVGVYPGMTQEMLAYMADQIIMICGNGLETAMEG